MCSADTSAGLHQPARFSNNILQSVAQSCQFVEPSTYVRIQGSERIKYINDAHSHTLGNIEHHQKGNSSQSQLVPQLTTL